MAISTLKNCRLVSSLWNSEATTWLKARSEIRFKYYSIDPSVTMKYFLYGHEMVHFAHPNLCMVTYCDYREDNFARLSPYLDLLLENCNYRIPRLRCSYNRFANCIFPLRLISRLAGNLEELELSLQVMYDSDDVRNPATFPFVEMLLLNRFVVDLDPEAMDWKRPEKYVDLIRSLISLTNRVSFLSLTSHSAILNGIFLREIVSNQSNAYAGLKELHVRQINRDGLCAIERMRPDSLVRLEIDWIRDDCEIQLVESVVQRLRNPLQVLCLGVPRNWAIVPLGELPYLERKEIYFRSEI
ncbi:hypothetical protein Fcan01_19162 [Folsomia candida]|uniref:Uncharacterized protein n=1 Tax=Folsomia candida TaxID=158441 RepID=A0A226DMD0_FOLCA|nr:hypothetical protein Fcan01_19162 [Folsomia candida]